MPTGSPDADVEAIQIRATKVSKRGKARWRLLDGFEGFVEEVGLQYFRTRGWEGLWGEVDVWSTLMALLFWDVIFARLEGVWYPQVDFPSKRQDMPRDFHSADFYQRRSGMIAGRLEQLASVDLREEIGDSYARNYGRPCRPIWNWDRFTLEELKTAASAVPRRSLLVILDYLMRDFGHNRVGVPDLFLWKDEGAAFAEVKGPTDRLSDDQKRWVAFLRSLGLRTFLVNVEGG
jgi:Fanconi-associated nuclease 1